MPPGISPKTRWIPLITLSITTAAIAQSNDPLVTDRPDFTESTQAVPTGLFQLEAGYTFTRDGERGTRTRTHTAPEFLLRAGLVQNLELRIGWEGYTWTESSTPAAPRSRGTSSTEDATDIILGFKLKLAEQDGWRPALGLILETTLPTGEGAATSNDVDPAIKFLWAYDIADRFALAGNLNLAVPTEGDSRFLQTSASLSLAMTIDDRWGAYAEYFGFFNNSHHTDAAHLINGGLTYLINDNFQLDVRVGMGLNEEADDFFTGVGFAYRF